MEAMKWAALGMCALVGVAIATAAFRGDSDHGLKTIIGELTATATGWGSSGISIEPPPSGVKELIEKQTGDNVAAVLGCTDDDDGLWCNVAFGTDECAWAAKPLRDTKDPFAHVPPGQRAVEAR
jgi:hypothetical protein